MPLPRTMPGPGAHGGRGGRGAAPPIVIVTGPPASGKTRLAEQVARELSLPLLAKDDVKLALYETLGARDMEESRRFGAAAFKVLFTMGARLLEAGVGLVLEGNFVRGETEVNLGPLLARARTLQVHCAATREETLRRYSARVRHEMHFDEASLPRVVAVLDSGRHDPLELGVPTLRVDTRAGYDPSLLDVLRWTRQNLES